MARTDKRGRQGKRLGKWVLVSQSEFVNWIEESGWTSRKVAEELGVSEGLISAWKSGRRFPSEVKQQLLARKIRGSDGSPRRKAPKAAPAQVASDGFDGARFKAWRKGLGLSRKALAAKLGVSAGSIFGWESGKSKPTARTRARMEQAIRTHGIGPAPSRVSRSPSAQHGSSSSPEAHAAAIRAAGAVLAAWVKKHETTQNELTALAERLRADQPVAASVWPEASQSMAQRLLELHGSVTTETRSVWASAEERPAEPGHSVARRQNGRWQRAPTDRLRCSRPTADRRALT